MDILRDIPELVNANVITPEIAGKIRAYYQHKQQPSPNRLFTVFGILGAVLVGLGIILIVAHNWDDLSRSVKTLFSFLPLFAGQVFCFFTLLKKGNSTAWRESSAAFLFFAIGACISLIAQVYNIPGSTGSFLVTWMLLGAPLIYIMRSSIASLLYIVGITYYAGSTNFFVYGSPGTYYYWLLVLIAMPHYYYLYRFRPAGNFMIFHNWLVPLSLVIALGTIAENKEELLFVAYTSLFSIFYLIGNNRFFNGRPIRNNSYLVIGSLGTIIILLILSFDSFWEDLRKSALKMNEVLPSPEFTSSVIISLVAVLLLYRENKNKSIDDMKPLGPVFLLFIIIYFIGLFSPVAALLVNLLLFTIGILIIRKGARLDHLGILNYGLLIITALVICRFFDSNISFVIRGLLFVAVGVGFFTTNYSMLKKRKINE